MRSVMPLWQMYSGHISGITTSAVQNHTRCPLMSRHQRRSLESRDLDSRHEFDDLDLHCFDSTTDCIASHLSTRNKEQRASLQNDTKDSFVWL